MLSLLCCNNILLSFSLLLLLLLLAQECFRCISEANQGGNPPFPGIYQTVTTVSAPAAPVSLMSNRMFGKVRPWHDPSKASLWFAQTVSGEHTMNLFSINVSLNSTLISLFLYISYCLNNPYLSFQLIHARLPTGKTKCPSLKTFCSENKDRAFLHFRGD